MNLLLLTEDDRRGDRWLLADERAEHVRGVLRAAPGDVLRAGIVDRCLARATVEAIDGDGVWLAVEPESTPPRPRTSLALAVPRPKMLRRVLRDAASLGVDEIVLLRSWRVERAYVDQARAAPDECAPWLAEGLMQGRGIWRPRVSFAPRFLPFVEAPRAGLRLVGHPGAATDLADLSIGPDAPLWIALGPEGGFIEPELASFEGAGYVAVRLGEAVMRVETAVIAALSQIDLLRRIARGRTG